MTAICAGAYRADGGRAHERNIRNEGSMKVTGALLLAPGWELTLMPVRFDDQYPNYRKVAGLSDAAFRLHVAAIFWCAWNGTPGFLPEEDLDQVCAQVRTPARFAAECVRRGTWHMADRSCGADDCPGPRGEAGWLIHDERFGLAVDEMEVTEKKSSGGRLGNHKRWHVARGVSDPDCPFCLPSDSESDTDRTPISVSDRSANPRSRSKSKSDLSLVDAGNQSSRRNARGGPTQPGLMAAVASQADRYARVLDDDDLLKLIKGLIHQRTGQVIYAEKARSIAAEIFGSAKGSIGNHRSYAEKAIRSEPDPAARWLREDAEPDTPPARPPWCGQCRESTRRLEDEDGYDAGPCPACNPRARRPA